WRNCARIRHHQLAIRPRWPQPIRAVDNGLSQDRAYVPRDLLDRPGRQPQINGAAGLVSQPIAFGSFAAAVALNVVQCESENDGKFIDEGRLKSCETILRDPDQRLGNRLMGSAFRGKGYARRRRHQDESRILITGIVERIEAAGDERIVQGADRQKALTVDYMRQAKRGQRAKQVHLGDTQFDVLALRRELPVEGGRDTLALERVSQSLAGKQARRLTHGPRLVDTVTSGEAVTMRSESGVTLRPSSLSSAPKPSCVDICGWIVTASASGTGIRSACRLRPLALANGT